DPGGDAERPAARRIRGERTAPAVVSERLERRLAPAPRARRSVADGRAEDVVSRAEDRRVHHDLLAGHALDPESAAVPLRRNVVDLNPGRWLFAGSGHGHETLALDETQTRRWSVASSHLAAGRTARRRGVPFRRLARRRRPVVVAGSAARAARHLSVAVQ